MKETEKNIQDSIQSIKEKSGHDLHLEIVSYLESKGWNCVISQHYIDIVTNLSRELDILATKNYPIGDSGENLRVRLFIECKYVKDINVVWFTHKDLTKSKSLVLESNFMKNCLDNQLCIINNDDYSPKYHHYMDDIPVVKLTEKKGQYDIFYKGLNGCIHSMIGLKTSEYTRYSFDYPVMIFNSFKNIFSATNNMEITENFQRAVDYSYKIEKEQINKYFIIDVVSFEMLDSFLDKIEKSDIAIMINKALSDIKEERFNRNFSNSSPSNFFDAI